ncbi:UDP-glucose 4-epimerase [Halogranum gelatinilyticum]|uniref:UDP-glucose 4-epimerase n=1 Tax=Halogranum gelatinilyticum TaxID=660521 RepID=A0A1G9X7F3_9EURY|nr:NAD-dependent epimerase/dehydratase family protein [Halogranum gelatinilyticum]SDM92678.1 UDP-glucose 4-epimerase [Halogranum gelatinilyticum]
MVQGQTVLITGGAGFIGSHLADALVEDNDVYILDNLSTGKPSNLPADVELIRGDIQDTDVFESLPQADLIFHEAALVSVPKSVEEPARSHAINMGGTLNVLEYARDVNARIVLASSTAIYGDADEIPTPEAESKKPSSPYGIDKTTLDHYAQVYHELYDLEAVPLRYFNVYGPRQAAGDYSGVISIFLKQALNDEPITVHGDGSQTRDFVHVDDVVQANLKAATTDHVGEPYNVGTGSETSIRELAETIRDVTDSNSEIVHTDGRDGDIERSLADISKAQSQLGYEPTILLSEGLATLVEHKKSN